LLKELQPLCTSSPDIYFVSRGENAEKKALIIAQDLRQKGYKVELDLTGSNFGKQFKRGDRTGAKICLVLGESEVENNTIQLKYLDTGKQETLSVEEIETKL